MFCIPAELLTLDPMLKQPTMLCNIVFIYAYMVDTILWVIVKYVCHLFIFNPWKQPNTGKIRLLPGETPALVQDRYSLPAICNHTAADAAKTKREKSKRILIQQSSYKENPTMLFPPSQQCLLAVIFWSPAMCHCCNTKSGQHDPLIVLPSFLRWAHARPGWLPIASLVSALCHVTIFGMDNI